MNPPLVAIIGRPNVGKSSLFNALARRRISIVEPSAGVTRDRITTTLTDTDGRRIELVDTGGMGLGNQDAFAADVESQIQQALDRALLLLMVVDADAGLMPQDRAVADRVRRLGKPVLVVANKVDRPGDAASAAEFHGLGLGEPIPVSALHKNNIGALRDRIFELVPGLEPESEPDEIRIAVVGRRNVGKSTFINAVACEERVIVNELPGTTRDAVDVRITRGGRTFLVIDTAGLRRTSRPADSVEFYTHVRADESIRRADVVLLMLDPRSKVSVIDKKLAAYVASRFKPCILVVNKWDLAASVVTGDFVAYANRELPLLAHAPVCFISAKNNERVQAVLDLVCSLWKQARTRVGTGRLNAAIDELKTRPQTGGRPAHRVKLYYATQIGVAPPAFVLFVNSPGLVTPGWRRTVLGFLRRKLPFSEIPILVKYRAAGAKSER